MISAKKSPSLNNFLSSWTLFAFLTQSQIESHNEKYEALLKKN